MKVLIIGDIENDSNNLKKILKQSNIDYIVSDISQKLWTPTNSQSSLFTEVGLIVLMYKYKSAQGTKICVELKKNPPTKEIPIAFILKSEENDDVFYHAFNAGASFCLTLPLTKYIVEPQVLSHINNYELRLLHKNQEALISVYEKKTDNLVELEQIQKKLINAQASQIKFCTKRTNLALQSANAGIFTYEVKTGYLDWDQRSFEIYGLTTQVLQKELFKNNILSWRQRVNPLDVDKVEEDFFTCIKNADKTVKFPYRIIKPDGSEGYVLAFATVERDEEGNAIRVFGLHLDFTEHYRFEEALRQSEYKFKRLTESLQDIVWKTDMQCNFLYLNPAFERILGYSINENKYPSVKDIFTEESLKTIFSSIDFELKKIETNGLVNDIFLIELQAMHKEGHIVDLEVSADFLFDTAAKPIAIQGIMHDITNRKKNERELNTYKNNLENIVVERTRELENSRHELEQIFNHAPVAMMLMNSQNEIVYINKAGEKLINLPVIDIKGKFFGNVFKCVNSFKNTLGCGFSSECLQCVARNVILETISSKVTLKRKETIISIVRNGKVEDHFVNIATSVVSEKPELTILLTIDDITEQKEARKALIESEEKYRKLFETKNEAVVLFDALSYKFIDVNQAACKLYGYSYDDFLKLKPQDILTDDESTDWKIKLLKQTGENQFIPNRKCRRNDGTFVIVEMQNSIFSFRGNDVICSIHRDITEKHQALVALKKSEYTLRMLVENIDDLFWIIDIKSNKLIYLSPNRERLTGRSSETLFENVLDFVQYVHPADMPRVNMIIEKVVNGENASTEFRTITANDEVKWLLIKAFEHYDEDKNQSLVFGLVSDITSKKTTERKILNAILETENREREIFAKELHDSLGANLSAIKMCLERLNADDLKPEKRVFYSQHALELVLLAAQTTKEISYNLKPHTLVNFGLISSIDMMCNNINALGSIQIDLEFNCPNIKLDNETELAIYRILSELINNSLKYANATNASLSIHLNDEKLTVNYKDNGKGFDPETAIHARGSGMKNIIARANALDAYIDINSRMNEGMTAVFELRIDN